MTVYWLEMSCWLHFLEAYEAALRGTMWVREYFANERFKSSSFANRARVIRQSAAWRAASIDIERVCPPWHRLTRSGKDILSQQT
jgi:hypothetical protein